ncbi:uncharacterized protein LOC117327571 [Pecten maximus]|uniref:uncharacterized protein LOC117327571 n=1 Tax=Pecten maximus TaxID=6579 RepID=UPI001458FEE9|nr:uncharacterized protein LOC117327571 [Pecten maximus]
MADQMYMSLQGLTIILKDNYKLDALMREHIFQYLGSKMSEKFSFFSFMDKLMQPLEYKLSTIGAFVNDVHSELSFMERVGIREIKTSSVQNLIQLLSAFCANFNVSFVEIQKEKNIVSFYLKMFSDNVLSSDAEILVNSYHSKYAVTYSKYRLRAEKYPTTWGVVMYMIPDVLQNDHDTNAHLWTHTQDTILQRVPTWRPTDGLDIYKTFLSKLRSTLDGYSEFGWFQVKLRATFPFTLKGLDWIKNTRQVIEQKEMRIIQLAKERDWFEVKFKMHHLSSTYSKFVKELKDYRTGIITERLTSESEINNLSEKCACEFQDILSILQNIWNTTTGRHMSETHDTFTLEELQYIPYQTKDFQNPRMLLNQESKLLPWIKFDFNLERFEDWMKSRLSLYEEVSRCSNKRHSVSDILKSLGVYICKYGGSSVSLDTVVSSEDVLCTLSTVRLDCNDYDSYPLEMLREKCGSSKHPSNTLCSETVKQRKEVLIEREVREAVSDQSVGDVGFVFDNIYNKLRHDELSRKYGLSISRLHILHTISRLYPEREEFGFYKMSFFQQNHQSFSADVFDLMSSFAIEQRNNYMKQRFRKHFCDNHGFCVEHKSSVDNFTSVMVQDRAHVVIEKDSIPIFQARKQLADHTASTAPTTHINIHCLIFLLVYHL